MHCAAVSEFAFLPTPALGASIQDGQAPRKLLAGWKLKSMHAHGPLFVCKEEFATQKVGSVDGSCADCKKSAAGWLDPDVEEFFCEDLTNLT